MHFEKDYLSWLDEIGTLPPCTAKPRSLIRGVLGDEEISIFTMWDLIWFEVLKLKYYLEYENYNPIGYVFRLKNKLARWNVLIGLMCELIER